jgi:phenylpropionate dioxygenase-like ring-hydroxylating dioxygenase large terminal subunit
MTLLVVDHDTPEADWSFDVSLPPIAYIDPARWQQERIALFANEWIAVARASDLPQAGDYTVVDIVGEPVIVVRAADGRINALSNVCRHRAMAMLEGSGHAARIMCPYHLWTYKHDGALLGAPFMEGAPAFEKAACALPKFACEEWLGWVFVNISGTAQPLAPQLAELAAKLPAELAEWRTTSTTHFKSPFNWKIIVENGTESYHNIGSHTHSIQPFWPGGQSRPIATGPAYSEVHHADDPDMGTFIAYTVFPAMTFTHQMPDSSILWYDLQIHGIDDCDMYLRVLMPPDRAADAEFVERMKVAVATIHQEDIVACGKVQQGVCASSAQAGPLSLLEAPLAHFHRWMAARLA